MGRWLVAVAVCLTLALHAVTPALGVSRLFPPKLSNPSTEGSIPVKRVVAKATEVANQVLPDLPYNRKRDPDLFNGIGPNDDAEIVSRVGGNLAGLCPRECPPLPCKCDPSIPHEAGRPCVALPPTVPSRHLNDEQVTTPTDWWEGFECIDGEFRWNEQKLMKNWQHTWQAPEYLDEYGVEVLNYLALLRHCPWAWERTVRAYKTLYYGKKRLRGGGRPDLVTKEGVGAVDDLLEDLRDQPVIPRLTPSCGLSDAARIHRIDKGQQGTRGDVGSDNSRPRNRMERYGTPTCGTAEVRVYGERSPCEAMMDILIDDGDPERVRRSLLLNPQFRRVGIDFGPHSKDEWMLAIDLSGRYREHLETPGPSDFDDSQRGYLCPIEEDVLATIDELRCNPQDFAALLLTLKPFYRVENGQWVFRRPGGKKKYLERGWPAVKEAIDELRVHDALPNLYKCYGLTLSSRVLAYNAGVKRKSLMYERSNLHTRLTSRGGFVSPPQRSGSGVLESVYLGRDPDALWIVISMLIDDRNTHRENRRTLLESFHCAVGVSVMPHYDYFRIVVLETAEWFRERDGALCGKMGPTNCPTCLTPPPPPQPQPPPVCKITVVQQCEQIPFVAPAAGNTCPNNANPFAPPCNCKTRRFKDVGGCGTASRTRSGRNREEPSAMDKRVKAANTLCMLRNKAAQMKLDQKRGLFRYPTCTK